MSGVSVPAAYAVRASPDYVWQGGGKVLKLPTVQWAIGPDNAFHWSGLGLLPYKDSFFSNATMTQQAGNSTGERQRQPPPPAPRHAADVHPAPLPSQTLPSGRPSSRTTS